MLHQPQRLELLLGQQIWILFGIIERFLNRVKSPTFRKKLDDIIIITHQWQQP